MDRPDSDGTESERTDLDKKESERTEKEKMSTEKIAVMVDSGCDIAPECIEKRGGY